MPTMAIADAAPAQISADEESTSEATEEDTSARFFTPSEQPAPSEDDQQESESAEDTIAMQMPTASQTPRPTDAPTMTAEAPVTIAPTLIPQSAVPSQRAMTPVLGIVLVVGGALLFGIAFMTAVTRRGDRRSRKDE